MAYTTIDDPSQYFQTTLYTGTGSDNAITNSGNSDLQPDWLWIKNRGATQDHIVFDTSRGFNGDNDSLYLEPNNTDAESHNDNDHVKSFNSDGFTMQGGSGRDNNNTTNYVAWQWKANGGTTASNTDGSITSTVQANTTAGFSIVTYTGNGSSGATIGHGLSSAPSFHIIKQRNGTGNWVVYNSTNGATEHMTLNTTNASSAYSGLYNDTEPTSSVITLGNDVATNGNTNTYIAYCWAEKVGYSKFGSYTGNGSTDGAFIYTGFKPAWLMTKNIQNAANWRIWDNRRTPFNANDENLVANSNQAENSSYAVDFLSNGWKARVNDEVNNSGQNFIYLAFAESPLVGSDGTPTTAR